METPDTSSDPTLEEVSYLRNVQLALPKECSEISGSLHLGIHGSHMLHITGEIRMEMSCKVSNETFSDLLKVYIPHIYRMHASKDFLDSSPFS